MVTGCTAFSRPWARMALRRDAGRIVQAAGNTVLTHLMATLHGALTRTSLMVATRLNASDHYRDTIFRQHCAIFEAVRDHAPERARVAMREHLEFVIRELRYYTRKNAETAAG